jgi:hypothetical protein
MLDPCKATVAPDVSGHCIAEDLTAMFMFMETTSGDSTRTRDGKDEENKVQVRM